MKKLIVFVFILLFLSSTKSNSCTIVMVSDSSAALAGSNEDATFPLTLIWYVPASKSDYARVCLGFKMIVNSVQGGMNEKGLFVDGNRLSSQGWKATAGKANLLGSLLDRILASCANIEDVKEFFNTYNIGALDVARIPVMDKTGASMIVEWYNGEVAFVETSKKYQVSTNFVESKYRGKEKPCWRYNKAMEMLDRQNALTITDMSNVLDATHIEGSSSTTLYSFVCDLKNGDIYVYNYHNYSVSIKINLEEELMKGKHEHYLQQLFDDRSADYLRFIETGPVRMLNTGYRRNMAVTLLFFHIIKTNYPIAFGTDISVNTLSQFGKSLIGKGKLEDAITIMERNVKEFPEVARSHFELGSLYLDTNNKEKAIVELRKTMDIDPDHKQAGKILKTLL
ncbi:MAG: linear amide C-N hydrolase [Bacteroidetes bacterium]|jgi:tetratricopeptide (TPR) repeat protein|nr:linear amide C-N hydrolase [Bacteroidota bacterium]MBT7092287.1 linear amide C-N hydrolase [Bacteroidota bacterium]MBT7462705.1 linear amide C-N hydrolase [Bacteroidota bacterium]